MEEVDGSNPSRSTKFFKYLPRMAERITGPPESDPHTKVALARDGIGSLRDGGCAQMATARG